MKTLNSRLILAGLTLVLLSQSAICQGNFVPAEVKDVERGQNDELVISFGIKGDPQAEYAVDVYLLKENDSTFSLKLNSLKGDLSGKLSGRTCKIVWNFAVDYPNAGLEEGYVISIKGHRVDLVSAETGGGWPWYYYAGGAVLVGGAVVLLTSEKQETPPPTAVIPTPPLRP